MRRPFDKRPEDRQRENVREELHAVIDRMLAAWPALEKQSDEMGRAFPTKGDGPSGIGGYSDPVSEIALNPRKDPAVLAADWINEFESWRITGRVLVSRSARLIPIATPDVKVVVERRSKCESCGDPAEAGSFKLDRWCDSCYRRLLKHGRNRPGE